MPKPTSYPSKVYLNGQILEAENAKISVFDRGFIFGDGVYEVMAQIGGRFFYGDAHMERLKGSLEKIELNYDLDGLQEQIPALLEASGLSGKDCMLYIQVTRGVAPRQHAYPERVQPTSMMYAWPKTLPDIVTQGVSIVTREDFRWSRCDIKMTSLLGNVMANQYAMEQDCYETLFVRDGIFTEASHCNVFFVKDGVVLTHPADAFILDGITRQVVLELCQKLGLEVGLQGVPFAQLHDIDEAFLTGTSTQITPIRKIDGTLLYDREAGPITRRLQEAFLALKRSPTLPG